MENKDLKFIKKQYGEDFMHLCRTLFPTILEKEGMLSDIISSKFAPSHSLCEDMTRTEEILNTFKNFIFNTYHDRIKLKEMKLSYKEINTPEELLDKAGYILYPECKTEEEIQSFRKYWQKGEELCTFTYGNRLKSCRVWFAIKKNIDEIKRENFNSPQRQDEYGTSAISIQFTRGENSTLSIKNRYNHTVSNPDATFGNNLDNIIPNLHDSFINTYKIHLSTNKQRNEFPGYVMDKNGKFYKYNVMIHNIYYCDNNVVIKNFAPINYDKSRFILFEYYLLDLKDKCIKDLTEREKTTRTDAFINSIAEIDSVSVFKEENHERTIVIKPKNANENEEIFDIKIKLNKNNNIIGYFNPICTEIGESFLPNNKTIKELELPNVIKIDDFFMISNLYLKHVTLPNVQFIGDGFLNDIIKLNSIDLPNVKQIGNNFLKWNTQLKNFYAPKLEDIGDNFLMSNFNIEKLDLPSCKTIGHSFLRMNEDLKDLNLPNVNRIDTNFLRYNNKIYKIDFPCLKEVGSEFFGNNTEIKTVNLPKLKIVGSNFLANNLELIELNLPNLEIVGNNFLNDNRNLYKLNLPNAKYIGRSFLESNIALKELILPNVKEIDEFCLESNIIINKIDLPNVEQIDGMFLVKNNSITDINLPNVKKIGYKFLFKNEVAKNVFMPNLKEIDNLFLNQNKCLEQIFIPNIKVGDVKNSHFGIAINHPNRDKILKKIAKTNQKHEKEINKINKKLEKKNKKKKINELEN